MAVFCAGAVSANAADYSFSTEGETDYYKGTDYVDRYDAEYN